MKYYNIRFFPRIGVMPKFAFIKATSKEDAIALLTERHSELVISTVQNAEINIPKVKRYLEKHTVLEYTAGVGPAEL